MGPSRVSSVAGILYYRGPCTLAELSKLTGIPQSRIRTHVRTHRDSYSNETHITAEGIKLRLWSVIGPIG